jgi:hypothetical protein
MFQKEKSHFLIHTKTKIPIRQTKNNNRQEIKNKTIYFHI